MKRLAVVAFGGNALLKAGEEGTIEQQEANARYTSERLLILLRNNYNLVITHGNGPQVGNIMLQNELAKHEVPEIPLGVADAMTESSVIYLVRHAERADDHPTDPTLSPEGEARATELARLLADAPLTRVFSTDLRRTMSTAAPTARNTGWGPPG